MIKNVSPFPSSFYKDFNNKKSEEKIATTSVGFMYLQYEIR
jgi:hypothetical protein